MSRPSAEPAPRPSSAPVTYPPSLKIGLVDTTFSRVNMGRIALDELARHYPAAHTVRRTVPGVKDLPVECQRLFSQHDCDIVMALGMVGKAPIDQVCAHESSSALQIVMLRANRHIIEVFVHMNEAKGDADLLALTDDRVRKHVHNAVWLVADPRRLIERAGTGRRQGRADEGGVEEASAPASRPRGSARSGAPARAPSRVSPPAPRKAAARRARGRLR